MRLVKCVRFKRNVSNVHAVTVVAVCPCCRARVFLPSPFQNLSINAWNFDEQLEIPCSDKCANTK